MFGDENTSFSGFGCEYYTNGLCSVTNLAQIREKEGCKSDQKSICCQECPDNKSCPYQCKIRIPTKVPRPRPHPTQAADIHNLPLGILGGGIAAVVAGFLLNFMMHITGHFYFIFVAMCGGIGGLGFGLPTEGDKLKRGLIGCFFAILAMLIGYYMIYLTPVSIYSLTVSPASIMSFPEFLSAFLEPLDYFFIFIGIVAGYFGGTGLFVFK